ncbi:helix-turn-helix domain-containing protein [Actinosynnema sp. NPDC047251]|uniref:Transcriptional regulator, AraC family n=1 Tax=Saccharothrix espanaensis (strain ATCC 51144 / DSM 44229 / JCM 9112 / NBRC 15066 / NRRL 15764) TaxID=1179773 RepID=K0JYG8_SACES|nr:helix-turn-helix domain-containing protein [Saccharothrix espanaensis]CCH29754.1 Transcriptional regulator, AraC family [Saccharothrix espanaensis DSM 44229]
MIEAEFHTEDLPVAERFASWRRIAERALGPLVLRTEHAADFRADAHCLDLGAVRLARLTVSPLRTERTPRLIRRFDPERYYLVLNLGGVFGVRQSGREAALAPGEMTLYDSSRPFLGWATDLTGPCGTLLVQFPKSLLPLSPDQVEPALATRLPGRDGLGGLLAGAVRELAAGGDEEHAARMAAISLDLLAALLARRLGTGPPQPDALVARVRAFIDGHLADPALCPAAVAAAHHISTRHLHRLFAGQDLGVAAWIRRRRLERSRHDLTARTEPVHVVAARWGFTDPAHFSRLFRSTYGMTPTDYRHARTT